MIHPAHYLITPKPELVALIGTNSDPDVLYILERQLWENHEGDRISRDAQAKRVKRAFATQAVDMLRNFPGLQQMQFSSPATSVDFDRWWIAEKFEMCEEVEDIEERYGLDGKGGSDWN
ncbi:hypothetical protein [Lacipirellula limnantheis]|uniref:Uncharacterized protein n=1 Tax=Lacipirellula limnantheis TaxID=2528024 RepID=A0A517TX67_9BACT|nr:hypothetical protein [Lacipirellula limnantheis]QDT72962.1 hypothetical protein I41_21490 [Lacipirellula limnantheis]